MSVDELDAYIEADEPNVKTKAPKDVAPGDVIKTEKGFVKVDKVEDDFCIGTVEKGPKEGQEVTVHKQQCEYCMSPHTWGQVKRFGPDGRGFKKQGRHLKYPRNKVLADETVDNYMEGEIDTDTFLEQVFNEMVRSVDEAVRVVSRAFENKLGREYRDVVESEHFELFVEELVEQYDATAKAEGCDTARDRTSNLVDVYVEQHGLAFGTKALRKMRAWWENNITEVYCP